ncbi:hypothetical protein N431DRAFT_437873 [Stipitochalara longipes BDJ]|nr:hypothetical protein N431DRAFT_437873 [Stipitochalara longipes BDJ]
MISLQCVKKWFSLIGPFQFPPNFSVKPPAIVNFGVFALQTFNLPWYTFCVVVEAIIKVYRNSSGSCSTVGARHESEK